MLKAIIIPERLNKTINIKINLTCLYKKYGLAMKILVEKLIILILFLLTTGLHAQNFQSFLNRINTANLQDRETVIDSFIAAVPKFPYTEGDSIIHFLYRGTNTSAKIFGDFNFWQLANMNKIYGTSLWYYSFQCESDARFFYKIIIDNKEVFDDSLNPNYIVGEPTWNLEVTMPGYIPPDEINHRPEIPHGTYFDTLYKSINLRNTRKVTVYLPPDYYTSNRRYPIIIFQDGAQALTEGLFNNVIDNLISQNMIEPVIGVFVPFINRYYEYVTSHKDYYTKFIAEELVPWLDSKFRTKADEKHRAIMGESNGGNISLWIGMNYPKIFGNIAAQSSRVENYVLNGYKDSLMLCQKIYLDIGKYDIASFIPKVRELDSILAAKGYEIMYQEFNEGHNWFTWRAHIKDALKFLYPPLPINVEDDKQIPQSFYLSQNYPNPFNQSTTIEYVIPNVEPRYSSSLQNVKLIVYDILGREIATLVNEYQTSGKYTVYFNLGTNYRSALQSGVYFYRLVAGHFQSVKKMILLK